MRISSFHVVFMLVIAGVVLAGCGNVRSEKTTRAVHEVSTTKTDAATAKTEDKSEGAKTSTSDSAKTAAEAPPKKSGEKNEGDKEPDRIAQAAAKAEKSEDDMLEPNTSELLLPTGDKASSLLAIETSTPKRTQINHNYAYVIRVINISDKSRQNVALANLRVTQQIPAKMTIANSKIAITNHEGKAASSRRQQTTLPSGAGENASAVWTINLLEPGDQAVITVTARGAERGRLVNYLSVQYDPLLRLETEITQPEIRLTKSGPKQPVENCRKIEYTYVLKNEGNEAVRDLTVQDKLDGGLKTCGGDAETGKEMVVLTCARLAGGEEKKWAVIVEAAKPGTYKSPAVVTWPGTKTTMSSSKKKLSEFQVQSSAVTTEVRLGKLKIEARPDQAAQYAGQKVTYTITVTNEGNAKIGHPQITAMLDKAALPGATSPAPASPNTWKLPALEPGKTSAPLKITVGSNALGKLESKFEASFDCDGQTMKDTASVTTEIKPISLAVAVLPSEERVEQGTSFTCALQVSNGGTSADNDLSLTVRLPEFAAFEALEGDLKASYDSKTRVVSVDTLKQLGPGENKRLRLRVKAEKPGKGAFVARLTSKALSGTAAAFESDTVTSTPAKKAETKAPESKTPEGKTEPKPEKTPAKATEPKSNEPKSNEPKSNEPKSNEPKNKESPSDKPKTADTARAADTSKPADKAKPVAEQPKAAEKTAPKAGKKPEPTSKPKN